MDCPRCSTAMQEQTLDGRLGRPVAIDVCGSCQSFWFDSLESIHLTPGATLALFRLIGEHSARRPFTHSDVAHCPRCHAGLRLTHDMQRTTRFSYLRCPNGHGRLTTFFDFLREKDFIRPLSPQQLAELRTHVQTVNCSNCGAPVDLTQGSSCVHCGSPLSMLDMSQAAALVEQLQKADARDHLPIDPALPLKLTLARREVEQAFGNERGTEWFRNASANGLVEAGLAAMLRWFDRNV